MTDAENTKWNTESGALLALAALHGVSYWSLYKVAKKGIRFREILKSETLSEFESKLGVKLNREMYNISAETWREFRTELLIIARNLMTHYTTIGYKIVHYGSPEYPQKFKELKDPPFWFFSQGNYSLLEGKSVGVVGTREPTEQGIFLTQSVVSHFIDTEYSTVSGLAYGIDQVAHNASILLRVPTIAVLGTGVDANYPKNSESIRKKIIEEGGLIISEYLPDQKASKDNFVRRNRLQAALSDILIPVEWKLKSGTAHTVRFAAELKRKILCPLLRNNSATEEITYSLDKYNAVIFNIPLLNGDDLHNFLDDNNEERNPQISLLGDE
ncbi:SMF protein [Klebsiella pneumoniae]|nr:SMF protein [Klebsiella pneumoniae]